MSDTVTINFDDQGATAAKLASWLRGWGWTCIEPGTNPVKMSHLRVEFGVPASTLHKALSDPRCPDFPEKGMRRRSLVTVTPELRAFLQSRFNQPKL